MGHFLLDILRHSSRPGRSANRIGWTLLLTVTTIVAAWSAPPTGPGANSGPLKYHREFVPSAKLGELARGHLPVSRARFEQLLRDAVTQRTGPILNEARVESAFYAARLEQDQWVDGRAELDVRVPDANPAWLSLVPCGIPIREPLWHGAEPEPAQVGWVAPGRIALLAARSAALSFKWSLQGNREAAGGVSFPLELPNSMATRVVFDIPAGYRLTSSQGILQRLKPPPLDNQDQDATGDPGSSRSPDATGDGTDPFAPAAWHRWQLELGGDTSVVVRAVMDQPRAAQTPIVLYRQDTEYDVAPPGIDVAVDLQLRIARQPLSELRLELSPSLTLVSARHGEHKISPTVTGDAQLGNQRIQLKFPTPLEPGQESIHLTAVTRQDPRTLAQLPRIKPINLLWQEETATVHVHLPLEVRRVETSDCRQFQMTPFSGKSSGETTRFQFFDQDGHIQFQLGPRRTGVAARSGTTFLFGVRASTAEQQTMLSAEGGDQFELRGQLHPPWSLESLTLEPTELLDDWQVNPTGGETQELVIRLREPLAVGQTASLTFRGRGLRVDQGQVVDGAQLKFVEFPDYRQQLDLIHARGVAPHRLQNQGIGDSRPLSKEMLDRDAQRLLTNDGEIVYDVTNSETRPSFVLKSSEPVYRADLRARFVVGDSQVEETFVIDCHPSEGQLGRVVLFLSGPDKEPVDWTFPEPSGGEISSRRYTPAEQRAAGIAGNGQVWELTLPMPLDRDFRLTGRRVYSADGRQPVSLLALPQAESQRGTLVLATRGAQAWEANFHRKLFAVPETTDASPATRPWGNYRYEPLRDVLTTGPAIVTIQPCSDPIGKAAWASTGELRSRYAESGQSLHQAHYRIEQTGAQIVNFSLPKQAVLQRILVDGVPITARTATVDPLQVRVPLPSRLGHTELQVDFSLAQAPLRFFDRVTAQPLTPDFPVLQQEWKIWLPRGQFVWDRGQQKQVDGFAVRLLGPLARQSTDRPWPDRMRQFLRHLNSGEQPLRTESPSDPGAGGRFAGLIGGDGIRIPLVSGQPTSVGVFARHWVRLAGWSCFFVGFALRWALRGRWGRTRAVVLAACLAACLLLPLPLAPLPAAFFWGVLLATFARWSGVLPEERPAVTPNSRTAYFTPSMRSLIGGCVVTASSTGNTWAIETAEPLPHDDSPTYRVVVPIEQDQAASKYVYLPPEFYRRLIQLSHPPDIHAPTSSLSTVTVSATLEVERESQLLALSSLEVACDLEALQPGSDVQLPIHLALGQPPRSVKVDGRETQWQWDAFAKVIRFSLLQQGRYRVTIELEPEIGTGDNQRTVDIGLPAAPNASLRLVGPANRPPIQVRTETSTFVLAPSGGDSQLALGPTSRLKLRWPARPVTERGTALAVADQLMWMRVRPGAVTVDALIKVEAGDRFVDRIELYVDETLRLLSLGTDAPAASVAVQPGKMQLVQVDFEAPRHGDFILPLRFLMVNVSGIGSIPVPHLQLIDQETRNRWLAVTVDSSMVYDQAFGEQLPSVSSQAFSQQWGPNTSQPNFAVQLPNNVANLKLSTVYRAAHAETSERLQIACRPHAVHLDYHADVDLEEGLLFQHRFAVPDEMQIENVEVWQNQLPIAHRWTHDHDHHLNVFLRQPVTRPHQLRIQGTIPQELAGSSQEAPRSMPLPSIHLLTAESTGYRFDILRAPEVALGVDEGEGLERVAPSGPLAGENEAELAQKNNSPETVEANRLGAAKLTRHAISLTRNGATSFAATLRCWRHAPTATGSLVTTMRRGPKNWWADVHIRFEVAAGPLDLVRLEVPTPLARRFEFSTDVTSHVTPLPNSRSLLEIWPTATENDNLIQLEMRVALDPEARDVPSLRLVDMPLANHFLVLPLRLDNQEVVWKISDLKPAGLPPQLNFSMLPHQSVYEVTRHPFRATLSSVSATIQTARIALCDVHLNGSSDRAVGRITYWVAPPPTTDLVIDIPRVCEIIELRVDGRLIQPARQTPGKLAIPLALGRLARRIEMIFITSRDHDSNEDRLEIPTPHGLKIERTLWTLRCPSPLVPRAIHPLEVATQATQNQYRLAAIHRLTQVPAGAMAEWTQAEQASWYRDWYERYVLARRQLTASGGELVPSDADRSALQSWDDEQAAIAQRYRLPTAAESAIPDDAGSLSVQGEPERIWRFVSTGPLPAVSIPPVSTFPQGLAHVLLALSLAAGVLLTHHAIQRPEARSWLVRWLHVLAIVAGMAICAFVTPSLLGWAVIVLAVLSSLISSFRSFIPQDSQNTANSELY